MVKDSILPQMLDGDRCGKDEKGQRGGTRGGVERLRPLKGRRVEAAVRQSVLDVVEVGNVGTDLSDLPVVIANHILLALGHVIQLLQLPVQIAIFHFPLGFLQRSVDLVQLTQIHLVNVACVVKAQRSQRWNIKSSLIHMNA